MVATALSPIIDLSDTPAPEAYLIRTAANGSVDGDYRYRLGSNLPAPLSAGWKRSARGAPGLPPPGAPSFSNEQIGVIYGLLSGAPGYQWAMTTMTASGAETLPSPLSSAHVMSAQGAAILALPGAISDPSNPAVSRRLYRTRIDRTTTLYRVVDIDGVDPSTYVDGMPDGSLVTPAPAANGTAIVSTISHVNGPLAAGGSGDWTQVLSGPASQQYAVDGPNGVLTFAAVDANKTVTITYTAASRVEKNLMQALVDRGNLVRRAAADVGAQVPDSNLTIFAGNGSSQYFGKTYTYTTSKPGALLLVTYALSVKVISSSLGGAAFAIIVTGYPDGTTASSINIPMGNLPQGYEGPLCGSTVLDLSTYGAAGQSGQFRFRFLSTSRSDLLFCAPYGALNQAYNVQFIELPG